MLPLEHPDRANLRRLYLHDNQLRVILMPQGSLWSRAKPLRGRYSGSHNACSGERATAWFSGNRWAVVFRGW